jgi:uncharacterized membrane protein YhhN
MQMKKINLFLHLLIIPLFLAEMISRLINFNILEFLTKPFLLIWIASYFYLNTLKVKKDIFIYLAFLFSWFGDMFLMFEHVNGLFFYAGVGGFLLAQLSYIKVFAKPSDLNNKGFLFSNPLWLIPFIIYLIAILYLILGGMKGIMIPVIIIYAFSLISMSAAALNRKGVVSQRSFRLALTGSILFVISDSMIAINKFYTEFPLSSFFVILTYFIAQYLIMQGLIAE